MALNNTTADALATTICTALGVTDTASKNKWKAITEAIYTALKTDIVMTILPSTVVTVGSATTQTGPAAPIPLSPA